LSYKEKKYSFLYKLLYGIVVDAKNVYLYFDGTEDDCTSNPEPRMSTKTWKVRSKA
jgi:hypothetical protein